MPKVCSKKMIERMWKETQRSARWKAMMATMGLATEPSIPRIQFRRDMTYTLMCAHYSSNQTTNLLTVNRAWFLRSSLAQIRAVVRHEMIHFALGANKASDRHGPKFQAACKSIQGHWR